MNSLQSEQMDEKFVKDFSLLANSTAGDKENTVCAFSLVEVVSNKHTDVGSDTGDEGQQLDEEETIFLERHCNSQCSESNATASMEARNSTSSTPTPTTTPTLNFAQSTPYKHETNVYERMGNEFDGEEVVVKEEAEEEEEEEVKNNKVKSTRQSILNTELELFEQCKETNGMFVDDVLLAPEHFEHTSPHPLSERWSPLGANYDDAMSPTSELLSPESELELLSSDSQDKQELLRNDPTELGRLRSMEEEQELLTTSLMALTSHFAHVQLRVRQIVEAPSHERDQLLKDLEEFAFRGIPEPIVPTSGGINNADSPSHHSQPDDEAVRQRQFELIEHLKSQLSELEKLAYESGAPVLPQHILLEKQKIIIDELKNKLNLQVDERDLPELTSEELKNQVDNAIGEFVGPLRMKEQLVAQLKTQITDLERFIAFLQCDTEDSKLKTLNGSDKLDEHYNSYAAKKMGEKVRKKQTSPKLDPIEQDKLNSLHPNTSRNAAQQSNGETLNSKAHSLLDKASLLMQMFATTHFGAKADQFQKNTLKKTSKGNHWGDLRAQLEVDIQEVASLAATLSFDREKLANMKRALKNSNRNASTSLALNAQNGAVTVPPRAQKASITAENRKELKAYTVSSDSDDDTYDCYAWERSSCRKTAVARYKGGDSIITISKELTTAVRKNFCMTLLRLIQHGLRVETESATSSLIVPFMRCLNPSPVFAAEHGYRSRDTSNSSSFVSSAAFSSTYNANYTNNDCDEEITSGFFGTGGSRPMHAWELILEYYYLKNGDEFNNTPARKLSQSFNLDIVDSQTVTVKQSFLSAVGMIIAMHRPYKRSYNAHFKAFVCAGLNCHQLVEWLNLMFSCSDLVDTYYTPNSYVARTGFRDSLRSIDALTKYDFDLPVDLAIRHFRNL
uniref:RUN domain-containing protein 1 n=1 Tax=Ceratitis capitata TaxID=7213 RepID=W8BD41_CERCA